MKSSIIHRWEASAWWGAALLVLVGYLATVPPAWQCEGVDEIEYLSLADSLDRGMGYTLYGQPYVYYPPLYPALASALLDTPNPPDWPKLYRVNAAIGWVALVLLCAWMRRADPALGPAAAWFALLAYYPWSFSTRYLMAEQVHFLQVALVLPLVDGALKRSAWHPFAWLVIAVATSAAVMSKASGIAIVGAMGAAGFFHHLRTRSWRFTMALALAAGIAMAIAIAWEVRAALVDPGAKESYGRWLLKWVGLSHESASVVASNYGEGVSGPTSIWRRMGFVLERLGQYVLSVPRQPPNFIGLAAVSALLVCLGVAIDLRRGWDSFPAWYLVVTFVMMSATSWISSYTRYLYPVTPLLFFYGALGVAKIQNLLQADRSRVPTRWMLRLAGLALLAVTAVQGWSGGPGAEGIYRTIWGLAGLVTGVALVLTPSLPALSRWRVPPAFMLATCVLFLAANTGLLIMQRVRIQKSGTERAARGLDHVDACVVWIRTHTAPGAALVSGLPRMSAFLTGRAVTTWDEATCAHRLPAYAWLLGALPGNPAFHPGEEAALFERVQRMGWHPVFTAGPASIYGPPVPAARFVE